MLFTENLHVNIFVVVFVQSGGRVRVSEPEVDGVGILLEGYAGEGDGVGHVGEEGSVFVAEIVVLGLSVVCWASVGFIIFLTLDFG